MWETFLSILSTDVSMTKISASKLKENSKVCIVTIKCFVQITRAMP